MEDNKELFTMIYDEAEILKIICEKKHGVSENLIKKIGQKEFDDAITLGYIKTNYCVWEVKEQAYRIYNGLYKEPTFFEKLKGYYCHYILGW